MKWRERDELFPAAEIIFRSRCPGSEQIGAKFVDRPSLNLLSDLQMNMTGFRLICTVSREERRRDECCLHPPRGWCITALSPELNSEHRANRQRLEPQRRIEAAYSSSFAGRRRTSCASMIEIPGRKPSRGASFSFSFGHRRRLPRQQHGLVRLRGFPVVWLSRYREVSWKSIALAKQK
jgi:hypothetical protein